MIASGLFQFRRASECYEGIASIRIVEFNGGCLDTAGFRALQDLFPAHVSGNVLTLGATPGSMVPSSADVAATLALFTAPAFSSNGKHSEYGFGGQVTKNSLA